MRSGDKCPKCELPTELTSLSGDLCKYTERTSGFVYFLVDAGVVVYVGKGVDLEQRMRDHRLGHVYSKRTGKKQFDSAYYIEVPLSEIESVELGWIRRLKPKYNLKHCKGYGRYQTAARTT